MKQTNILICLFLKCTKKKKKKKEFNNKEATWQYGKGLQIQLNLVINYHKNNLIFFR